jgi:hypothetical protein
MKTRTRYLLALTSLVLCLVASSVATASPPDTRFKVVLARVVTMEGKRHLLLRVNGPARTVKVAIILTRANGRVLSSTVRKIRTKRRVLVSRFVIPVKARAIHVRVLGHVG